MLMGDASSVWVRRGSLLGTCFFWIRSLQLDRALTLAAETGNVVDPAKRWVDGDNVAAALALFSAATGSFLEGLARHAIE